MSVPGWIVKMIHDPGMFQSFREHLSRKIAFATEMVDKRLIGEETRNAAMFVGQKIALNELLSEVSTYQREQLSQEAKGGD